MLALKYGYYIFLIFAICILFHVYINQENLFFISRMMTILLFVCSGIALWETLTGHHLVRGYLGTAERLRLLEFVPGGFYSNPNDFATYVIQIIPFSFASVFDEKRIIRAIATINFAGAFFIVTAANARIQVIILLAIYVCFMLFAKKTKILKIVVLLLIVFGVVGLFNENVGEVIVQAIESVSQEEILGSMENGSLRTRINLLKNGALILLDTFLFGVGAGCHRTVMAEYSASSYGTNGVLVMHNLLGEIFVDYGIFIGIAFLITIIVTCGVLLELSRKEKNYQVKSLAFGLAIGLGLLILCGVSSSSILQQTSLWTTFCFSSVFIKMLQSPDISIKPQTIPDERA